MKKQRLRCESFEIEKKKRVINNDGLIAMQAVSQSASRDLTQICALKKGGASRTKWKGKGNRWHPNEEPNIFFSEILWPRKKMGLCNSAKVRAVDNSALNSQKFLLYLFILYLTFKKIYWFKYREEVISYEYSRHNSLEQKFRIAHNDICNRILKIQSVQA